MKRYIHASDDGDYGYGFDSNGDPIDESTVDEMYRIASEILEHSELSQLDPWTTIDEDSFEYFASSPYINVSYVIPFDAFSDKIDINSFVDWDEVENLGVGTVDTKSGRYEIVVRFSIVVAGSQIEPAIEDILVKDSGHFNDYLSREYMQIIDEDKFCDYISDLAAPTVNEIFSTLSNI